VIFARKKIPQMSLFIRGDSVESVILEDHGSFDQKSKVLASFLSRQKDRRAASYCSAVVFAIGKYLVFLLGGGGVHGENCYTQVD